MDPRPDEPDAPTELTDLERDLKLEAWQARDIAAALEHHVAELTRELADRDDRLRTLVDDLHIQLAKGSNAEQELAKRDAELAEVLATKWWRLGRLPRRLRRIAP